MQEAELGGFSESEQIFPQQIFVFGQKAFGIVSDMAGVVAHDKVEFLCLCFGALDHGKVRMLGEVGFEFVHECEVRGSWKGRFFIEEGKNSIAFGFEKFTDDDVVEEIDSRPFNAFVEIFGLFTLESFINKNLLKFFICIIDTELFKTIISKNFKSILNENKKEKKKKTTQPINIKNAKSDTGAFVKQSLASVGVDGCVNFVAKPLKESKIQIFCE
jgi:hypothetical protein